jgi:predicted nucleic acid-binding protein
MAPVIVDTGPLVALFNRSEKEHAWICEQLHKLQGPLFTCDAVLSETCFLLAEYPHVLLRLAALLEREVIVSDFESNGQISRVFGLMQTYRNVPMSFADACLVCMVEKRPGAAVLTLDRDFLIYRQQRRRVVPLIAPFS